MTQRKILIRLGAEAPQRVQWLLQYGENDHQYGEGALQEVAAKVQGGRVSVLVPADAVLCTQAKIPSQQRQRVRRALPYVLEDQLAGDVEQLHFALNPRGKGGDYAVAVVDREAMERWQTLLAEAELRPHALYPESLALPLEAGQWSLWLNGDEALLRTESDSGYPLPTTGLGFLLERMVAQADETAPETIRFYHSADAATPPLDDWPESVAARVEFVPFEGNPLSGLFAAGLENPTGLNLLQGDYSRKEQLGKMWRPWRASAALLGIWLLLQGGISLFDYQRLSAEDEKLAADIETLYRQTFPQARKVVNPRVQMEQHLEALRSGGSGGGFVAVMAQVGPLLSGSEIKTIKTLRYKDGTLELDLELKDLPALDGLKQKLADEGLQVEIQTASTRDNKVESRLVITGRGA